MIIKNDKILFFTKKDCKTEEKFLDYLKVKKGSYIGNVVSRVYFYFFGDKHKVVKYYKKYYGKEFASCKEFLINRWNISDEIAEEVSHSKYYFTSLNNKKDGINYRFEYDDEFVELFDEFIGGKIINENQDNICNK